MEFQIVSYSVVLLTGKGKAFRIGFDINQIKNINRLQQD